MVFLLKTSDNHCKLAYLSLLPRSRCVWYPFLLNGLEHLSSTYPASDMGLRDPRQSMERESKEVLFSGRHYIPVKAKSLEEELRLKADGASWFLQVREMFTEKGKRGQN